MKVGKIYLSKPGKQLSISENTDAMLENPWEETMFESSQIKHVKWNMSNAKKYMNDVSAKAFITLGNKLKGPLHEKISILN